MLLELAARRGEGYVSAREIAQRRRIPPKFIGQVAAVLSRHGWVEGARGPSGGLRLVGDASRISVKDVLELVEGPFGLSRCLVDEDVCEGRTDCPLKGVWATAQRRMLEVLEGTTIADLVAVKRVLGKQGGAGPRDRETGGGSHGEGQGRDKPRGEG